MESRSFYNEILTEHNLRPEYKHDLPDANIVLEGVNPNCGDDIFLKLKVENEGKQVVALSAGTAALHLGLILLGIGEGDEVICQSFTFSASANPIAYQGATPVFVDSEEPPSLPSDWISSLCYPSPVG